MKRVAIIFLAFGIASCQTDDVLDYSSFGDDAYTVYDTSQVDYYADDQLIVEGKLQLRERNFGKAYAIYKKAIEVFPNDPVAWLGYAAASDHLRRFDNADLAYRKLSTWIGGKPQYWNNVGYSHLLRGNLRQARRYFLKAYEIDPGNETTANNIELLRNSINFAKRSESVQGGI